METNQQYANLLFNLTNPFTQYKKERKWPDGNTSPSTTFKFRQSTTFVVKNQPVEIFFFPGRKNWCTAVDANGAIVFNHSDKHYYYDFDIIKYTDTYYVTLPKRETPAKWRPVCYGYTVTTTPKGGGAGENAGWYVAQRLPPRAIAYGYVIRSNLLQDEQTPAELTQSKNGYSVQYIENNVIPSTYENNLLNWYYHFNIDKQAETQIGELTDLNRGYFKLNPISKKNDYINNEKEIIGAAYPQQAFDLLASDITILTHTGRPKAAVNQTGYSPINLKKIMYDRRAYNNWNKGTTHVSRAFDVIVLRIYAQEDTKITVLSDITQEIVNPIYGKDALVDMYTAPVYVPLHILDGYVAYCSTYYKLPFTQTYFEESEVVDANTLVYS